MHQQEKFSVRADDGVELKGTLILPQQPKAIVQFNAGTATKKEFYLSFLNYLADHQYACCLWDYRGNGESAPPSLKGCNYTFSDYGLKDMPAIKRYLEQRFSDLPLFVVSHSAGGQQIGFVEHLDNVKGMVAFAVSTGYVPHMPFPYRLTAAYFFYLFSPISIALTGYVAAKRWGIMEDLPKKVLQEWRAWCGKPNYLFHDKFYGKTVPRGHYQNLPFPIHVFWASDDPISNKRTIPALWNYFKSSSGIEYTLIQPQDIGQKSIGHFGFFKKRVKESIWKQALDRLEHFHQQL